MPDAEADAHTRKLMNAIELLSCLYAAADNLKSPAAKQQALGQIKSFQRRLSAIVRQSDPATCEIAK